ncbi:hypothetical protein [Enterococcus gilvus]|uniref:hypothetical protein n=1 Tax=Enterococcus gilvus TaxID=160453 RepID=UPI0028D0ACFE|nr:hypothetical protein [Enterococcus gilvus]
MTTMMAIIGTIVIIAAQVAEYNLTEIHIPKTGTFNDDDEEPPHVFMDYPNFSTILVTTSLGFPSQF